jgi:transcriptional regulator with XRE-family HTH domain
MVDNMNIADFIKKKRKEMNLSLREFADKCDISHTYLNSLEKGIDPRSGKEISPTLDTVEKIAIGTNVPLADLLAIIGYINYKDIPVKPDDISERISKLPEKRQEMIETMLTVFENEQKGSDDGAKNNVNLLG